MEHSAWCPARGLSGYRACWAIKAQQAPGEIVADWAHQIRGMNPRAGILGLGGGNRPGAPAQVLGFAAMAGLLGD